MKTIKIACSTKDHLPLSELNHFQGNLKSLSKDNYKALSDEIKQTGFAFPVMVWKNPEGINFIIGGHQRVRCLTQMRDNEGFEIPEVPIVYVEADDLKSAKRRVLQDVAQYGHVERDGLYEFMNESMLELDDISKSFPIPQVNLDIDDFRIEYFEDVTKVDPKSDENEVSSLEVEPKVALGDLFTLGKHRLLCGDSTKIEDVDRLMKGEKAILMVTDPHYGVKLNQSWRDEALDQTGNANTIKNDDRADWYDVWAISNVQVAYVWHASAFSDVVMDSLRRAGFDVRQQIIWNKSVMVLGRGAYHWKHEPCWYAVRKGCDANWKGDRKQVTVWDAAQPAGVASGSNEEKTEHPTQKPISLYEKPIENHTLINDLLYEPFSGSGSGFIACSKLSRRMYGMELDPKYCTMILNRWAKYTGEDPVREDGKKWSEIKNGQ